MSTPRAKILVADDSSVERAAARTALEDAGYAVMEAVDGQQALEVFARDRPDLVMLDVVMPRLTGLETCRILKAKAGGNYLPVIMVSTRNSVNARVEGLRSGADDYLGKPYDAEELRARVEALLRTRKVIAERAATDGEPGSAGSTGSAGGGSGDGGSESEPPTPASTRHSNEAFKRRAEEEFDRAERYSDPLACLRVELDDYDGLVKRHSSDAVAGLVRGLRDVIEASVRKIDLVFRLDPRGYILLLPNTHFPGALAVAERICLDSAKIRVDAAPDYRCTVSVGVSFFPNKDTHSVQDLLDLVGAALDRARSEGGGKICLFQHQGYLYAPEAG
ncbi:GGDEF domain-containing response regulator [Enhygromyxa salina]|uniref:Response regulator MprA n=1 Tax=Enhygromyxa salina TaxID=215803 RepID=A0A2S9YUE3_9BACT|nr:response regulator [Enhygromyxa salina]PRQ08704.1 Response regulator MprA [Enhygromyxa salina]